MTSAWMGMSEFEVELKAGRIRLDGDTHLAATCAKWIARSGLASKALNDAWNG